ncbi:VOC family protein [Nocardia sp. CDC159]|uniref:VOC family protein n=1 Tax=Nocardia pulmonis TaxID=2951408 RepID=A0A9X2ED37_9NOCA|nr:MULTISPECIES: VOC family protein [Nocardia]MCM6778562.1 VOC family protein [Nocardia pulmonis]MCM6791451.1 VOC family protein [Nocardia sp. CDC159]
MRFGGVTLMVSDVAATASFYANAFGLSQVFADPDGTFVVLGSGVAEEQPASALTIEHWRKIENYARPTSPGGFRVLLEHEDVDAVYDSALAAGATDALPPTIRPWGQKVAAVRDPNGVIVEIGEPIAYR